MDIDFTALLIALILSVGMAALMFVIAEYIEFGSDSPILKRLTERKTQAKVEPLDSDSLRVQAYVRIITRDPSWKLR